MPDHETNFRRALDHELQRISAFYEKKVRQHITTCSAANVEVSSCGKLFWFAAARCHR